MPSLTRRKSVTPIDRAPSVVNRPSSSPVRLMVRPHSAVSKTIGEYARQYSSFTQDGFFPLSMDANKAPRGKNEIDKELLVVKRKLLRAQSASVRNVEHDALEGELNRVLRLPLADFLKVPPTVDPHSLASTITSSRSMSPLLTTTASHHAGDAALQAVLSSRSPSGGGAQQQQQQVVPNTTCGSRPTTPSVYIGGRISVTKEVQATPTMLQQQPYSGSPASRPTSAATDVIGVSSSSVGRTSCGNHPLAQHRLLSSSRATLSASSNMNLNGSGSGNGNRPASRNTERGWGGTRIAEEEGPFTASQKPQHRPSSGHLVLVVRGTAAGANAEDATASQWSDADKDLPQWAHRGLPSTAAHPPSRFASGHRLPAASTATNTLRSAADSNVSMADGGCTSADGSGAAAAGRHDESICSTAAGGGTAPHLKQRHQTQTRKQQGFNISTSSISHEADPMEYQMNALLRSRPMSAPSGGCGGGGGSIRHPAPVYPLRAVFLH